MADGTSRLTPYDDEYPTCERTTATLLVYTGDLEASCVTERLGIEPSEVRRRGERIAGGLRGTRVTPLNAWFLTSEGQTTSRDLRRHLDWLLDQIEPAAVQLAELQRESGVTMAVQCIWWSAHAQGGPTLWPEQMRRLAALDLECHFDISFYGDDDGP